MSRHYRPGLGWAGLLLLLVACTDAPAFTPAPLATATPAVTATLAAIALPPTALPTVTAAPTATALPPTATVDTGATAAYATITALARADAATATALAAPTNTPSPASAATVPPAALGTYHMIMSARAEGLRIFREPATLVLSAPRPGGEHSAELLLTRGVRTGHELADLSPGKTIGALVLATSVALLPPGLPAAGPFQIRVIYNPSTKYLTIEGDPAHGFPGGWSAGPTNKERKPRSIAGGTLMVDLGTPGQVTGQMDLRATPAGGAPLLYSGGFQGSK